VINNSRCLANNVSNHAITETDICTHIFQFHTLNHLAEDNKFNDN